jgi:hypothetical protein
VDNHGKVVAVFSDGRRKEGFVEIAEELGIGIIDEWKGTEKQNPDTMEVYVPLQEGWSTIEYRSGIYRGHVHEGVPHGHGVWIQIDRYDPNWSKYVGGWKDGERWSGTLHDSEGNVVGTWSEGGPE